MASVFTKICNREIPAHIVAETNTAIAFFDVNPIAKGHLLVVPKKEVDVLYHLDEDTYTHVWSLAKKLASAMEKVFPCKRVGIAVIGLEVPHAHIHLVPISTLGDLDFGKERLNFSPEEYKEMTVQLQNTLNNEY